MKYRVWCLSWDDAEDDGMSVVPFDPATDDYAPSKGEIKIASFNLASASEAVEAYADFCHDHRDGYESTWPLMFRVMSEDGTVSDFEVDREMVAQFSVRPVAVAMPGVGSR